jgi:NADPH-dependent 2,4-dienoyl-CoA reductase/sulfur reductase-like enzyme
MSAASQATRANPGLDVAAYEKGAFVSYGACGIPYYIAGEIPSWEDLVVMTPERFAERGVDVRVRHEVVELRLATREVTVRDGVSGRTFRDRYDYLVLATGGAPVSPPVDGTELDGVVALRNLEDGIALRECLDGQAPRHAVIVGTGLIGLEMAEAFAKRGIEVTLVGRSDRLLGFDPDLIRPVVEDLEGKGVRLFLETQVEAIEGTAGRAQAVTTSEGRMPADLVLLAVGLRPSTELARRAGVPVGRSGAIATTDRMRTEAPGVFAVGDCAEVTHVVSGEKVHAPLALSANRTGRVAGDNLAHEARGSASTQRFRGTARTMVTKVFDHTVAQTGLDLDGVRAGGFDAQAFTREGRSRAGYYPGSESLWTRIVADRRTRRLLGAQMVWKEGVSGRIDVFATALFGRMTVDDVYNLDLAYAPPFGPVYDPVIEICGRAALELAR